MADAGHETGPYGGLDAQVAQWAAGHENVFALWQLGALGLTANAVHKRAAAGRLHRVHHTVYSLGPPALLSLRGRYLAAVLACGGGRSLVALSHRSAADHHGLRRCDRRTVEVVVPGRSTRRHPGIQVHRSRTLSADDVTVVEGIPTTTAARSLLDLAAVVGYRALERALDQAEVLRVFDLTALRDQLERNPHTRGARMLRGALDRHTAGTTATWSELEERFLAACSAARLPRPEVNAYVDPGDGEPGLRPDFVWRAARVAVEADSVARHLTRGAFEIDRRRDQRLAAAGWRVIRVTWRQLQETPDRVTATVAALLATGYGAVTGPTTL